MTAQNVNLIYKDTKANIEAQSNFEGFLSYATDTNQLGFYNGTSWVWFTFSNMQDEILAAPQKYPMEIVDLMPILDGSDGNSLKYVLSTTLLTFVQNTLRSVGTIQPATTALNDFVTGNGSGYWVKKTLAETITILRGSLDSVYAATANGVTNGDSHDHNGGDGAQIDHVNLSNKGTNTHAQIDTHLSTAHAFVAETCTVYHNTTQTIGTGTGWTDVAFNSEVSDPLGWHDTVTNNSRIYPGADGTKEYIAIVQLMNFASNTTGLRGVRIVDGSGNTWNQFSIAALNGDVTDLACVGFRTLGSGDYLKVQVRQTSGGNLNLSSFCKFTVARTK